MQAYKWFKDFLPAKPFQGHIARFLFLPWLTQFYLPGLTVNNEYYLGILKRLRKVIEDYFEGVKIPFKE